MSSLNKTHKFIRWPEGHSNKDILEYNQALDSYIPKTLYNTAKVALLFCNHQYEYVEITSTDYSVIGSLVFPGSANISCDRVKIIASRSKEESTSYMRLFDITNNNVIATISWSTTPKTTYVEYLSNIPENEAVFEVQMKRNGGGTSRIHYLALY